MQLTFHSHAPAPAQRLMTVLTRLALRRMLLPALVANIQTTSQPGTLVLGQPNFTSNVTATSARRMTNSEGVALALIVGSRTTSVKTNTLRPILSEELIQ